jgi:hypothetical protein
MRNWIREYRAAARRRRLLGELRKLAALGDCAASRRRAVYRELFSLGGA